jgi:hypothetical protein
MLKKFALIFAVASLSLNTFALVIDRAEMDLRDEDQKTANTAVLKFEMSSGVRLNIPAIIQNSRRFVDETIQSTLTRINSGEAFALTQSVSINAEQRWTLNDAAPAEKCLILFTAPGYLSGGITRKSIVAHEVFHCFQFQMAGTYNGVISKPAWIFEGSAMFAGEDFVEEATPQLGEAYFQKYVGEVKPLFERSYDAYPFFLHLQKEGVNVYQLIKTLIEARVMNFEYWQIIVNTVPHDALITWATSLARNSDWGRDWNLKVNSYSPHENFKLPFTTSSTEVLPLTLPGTLGLPRHDSVRLVENKVIKVNIENGVGAVHYYPEGFPNGRTVRVHEGETVQFCFGNNCDCPGADTGIRTFKVAFDYIFIASVSTRNNHKVHIDEGELDCCGNQGRFDQRMVGTWSTGVVRLLNLWLAWPGVGGERTNTSTGTVEFKISPQGNFVKTYKDVQFNSVVNNGRSVGTAQLNLYYEVAGCITTRAINDEKGWFELSNIIDQTEWKLQSQPKPTIPMKTTYGQGEWFQFGVCVQGENGCSSTYYFEGDKLRFNGGVANGAYTDLERISD